MLKEKLVYIFAIGLFSLSFVFLLCAKKEADNFILTSLCSDSGTVIIDAGHGGEDGGAVGVDNIIEKDINLKISKKLEHILNLFAVDTDMTRREDVSLNENNDAKLRERKVADIKKRVKMIVNTPSATLISIHQNSFQQDKYSGAQVFYSKNNVLSEKLAKTTQECLRKGINADNKRIAKQADKSIYILEKVNCPAILVECGFITNPEEANELRKDTYQTKVAVCIAAGFLQSLFEE